jgi:hypothetical protein
MSDFKLTKDPSYQALVDRISAVYAHGQLQAHRAVNEHLTRTFWQIGHDIVEYEQGGQTRAAYGQSLITNLSRDLRLRHGKGFSRSNVIRARQFYLAFPKGATLSHLLSWYATYKMDSQLFVQKYQLYLPDREELRGQLEAALQEAVEQEQDIQLEDEA